MDRMKRAKYKGSISEAFCAALWAEMIAMTTGGCLKWSSEGGHDLAYVGQLSLRKYKV